MLPRWEVHVSDTTRRQFLMGAAAGAASLGLAWTARAVSPEARKWPLGLNTYCLRFQRWNDRQLIDYCIGQKLDAVFLQDSMDPRRLEPAHWAEVRGWAKDAGLHLEVGGAGVLSSKADDNPKLIALLRAEIERASGMGSPIVRARVANDRYALQEGSLERQIDRAVRLLREVRNQAMDAGVRIAIENHKELQAWETRRIIEEAGKEFVGSYLDTGNPVFVAEDPATTVEELGPYALSFHLRDSVVYDQPEGVAVQWVPLGEGTVDFKALVARAAEILPESVHVYCKPITARPPVVLAVYSEEFWMKWFPRARSADFSRFLALARRGRPYDKPQIVADVPELRDRYMEALKSQQLEHMERSLEYCRRPLGLGIRS
jgi:sugar phosphate isomerase/epimerase